MLTTGESLESLGINQYEIAFCEPLHDLKNIITNILLELPEQLPSGPLQKTIKKQCDSWMGMTILIHM